VKLVMFVLPLGRSRLVQSRNLPSIVFRASRCAAVGLFCLLSAFRALSADCVSPSAGLVAWWPGSTNANDVAGANDGALVGGTSYTAGEVGQAFNFNGVDAGVRVPASASLNVGAGAGLTVELWINSADESGGPVVDWTPLPPPYGVHLWANYPKPGCLYANLVDTSGNSHVIETGNLLTNRVFQHVALTYHKASGVAQLFLNGVVVQNLTLGIFTPNTGNELHFGYRPNGYFFNGMIDEVTLYDRALTANEIAAIYNASSTGKCAAAPSITSQPQSQTAIVGSNATFFVTATGAAPVVYQWLKNGTHINGPTNSSLAWTDVQLTNAGSYSVLITNAWGNVTSQLAILQVLTNGAPSIRINNQLAVGSVSATGSVQLSISGGFANGFIFYTLDGTTPSTSSPFYAGPVTLTESAIVRAMSLSVDFTQTALAPAVTVQFTAYPLTASTGGGGGGVTVNGQAISPPIFYPIGSTVTVGAVASNGWSFMGWQGNASGTNNPLSVTMNQAINIQAIFGTVVGTNTLGGGGIVLSQPAPIPFGAELTVSAVPNAGRYFLSWGGAASGTNTPTTIAVTNANPTLSALFSTLPGGKYSLAVVVIGNGAVAISPQQNYYNPGDSVTLSASTTNARTGFNGWTGDALGTKNPLLVVISTNIIVEANFSVLPALNVSPSATNVILTWPTNTAEFTLRSTTNLVSAVVWTPVSPAPVVVNGQNTVTNPISAKQRFYRLNQ